MPAKRGADEPGGALERGVERVGCRQLLVAHDLGQDRVRRGQEQALQRTEDRRQRHQRHQRGQRRECQPGNGQHAEPAADVGEQHQLGLVHAVGQHAADRDGDDAGEAEAHQDQAELAHAGVAQDQERQRDHVELVTDQGAELPGEQERVVAVPQWLQQRRSPADGRLGRGGGRSATPVWLI